MTPTRRMNRSPSTAKSVTTWPTSSRDSSGEPMIRLVRCPATSAERVRALGPNRGERLGRAGEREVRRRRGAGADGEADARVRAFGGLVDAAEHRLAADVMSRPGPPCSVGTKASATLA